MSSQMLRKQLEKIRPLPPLPSRDDRVPQGEVDDNSYERFYTLKDRNKDLSEIKMYLPDLPFHTMPQWMSLLTTFVCNLRCPHCETHGTPELHRHYNNKKLDMPYETLSRVAKQSLPWADEFCLTMSGEPLATPNLQKALHELSQYGAKLDLTTNGTYFSKETLLQLIPMTSKFQISIDGATQLTCEAIRLGVKFKKLLGSIRLLTRTLELLPAAMRPPVCISFTIMGSNIRDLPELVRMASGLGIQAAHGHFVIVNELVHVRNEVVEKHKALYNAYYQRAHALAEEMGVILIIPPPFPGIEEDAAAPVGGDGMIINQFPENHYETLPAPESWLDHAAIETEASEIAAHLVSKIPAPVEAPERHEGVMSGGASIRDKSFEFLEWCQDTYKEMLRHNGQKIKYCDMLHKRMYVSPGGDATPCCVFGTPVLGNVNNNTVEEIWNGELYKEFRRRFRSSDPVDCCKNCIHVQYRSVE
jgi:radical SAM protein with 4Fe4S-binding SPASM domain